MRERFAVPGVDAGTPLGAAAGLILRAKAAPLFALEAAAVSGRDADAVHDMRVASRRLREALRLFAPVYPRKVRDGWYGDVKTVTTALGRVRDADVFIDAFTRLASDTTSAEERAALAYLVGYRQAERAAHLREMRARLGKLRLAKARPRFEKAVSRPRDTGDCGRPLAAFAQDAVLDRLSVVASYLPDALTEERIEEQHAMRIACKRLRYATEALAPCFGAAFVELHGVLTDFQDVLGELHDADVFIAAVSAIREEGDAPTPAVTAEGLDAVLSDLSSRRGRRFRRFERLCAEWPPDKLRAALMASLEEAAS